MDKDTELPDGIYLTTGNRSYVVMAGGVYLISVDYVEGDVVGSSLHRFKPATKHSIKYLLEDAVRIGSYEGKK